MTKNPVLFATKCDCLRILNENRIPCSELSQCACCSAAICLHDRSLMPLSSGYSCTVCQKFASWPYENMGGGLPSGNWGDAINAEVGF